MLVQSDQCTEHRRGELLGEDRRRRAVTGHNLVLDQFRRDTLCCDFFAVLTECQHLCLGEQVAHQQVMHAACTVGGGQILAGAGKADEVCGNHAGALVHKLVESMLAVGAGLAPVDLAGVVVHTAAVVAHGLSV